jgi:mevalonate pyrophosphate decarboxylase
MNRIHKRTAILFLLALPCLAAGTTASTAHAGNETFGSSLLKCFHPTADFVQISYAQRHGSASGKRSWKGWLTYSTKNHEDSAMSFVLDMKTEDGVSFVRVTPLTDSSTSAPETSCYLRDWQPVY